MSNYIYNGAFNGRYYSGKSMKPKYYLEKCFISASKGVNVSPLMKLLEEYGVQISSSMNTNLKNICFAVDDEISECSFICAIISKNTSSNVIFEIGLARGAKKPLFLIVESEEDLPSCLRDIIYIRAAANDIEKIRYPLEMFLNNYQPARVYQNVIKTSYKLDGFFAENMLKNLDELKTAAEIESLVANLFKNLNDVITVAKFEPNTQADMSLWIDELENKIGNPILVEIKSGHLSYERLLSTENQMREYGRRADSPLGILIYYDRSGKKFRHLEAGYPLIIWLELRDLILELSKRSLAQIIIGERNKIVHGLPGG
jgi:hypothetical protein